MDNWLWSIVLYIAILTTHSVANNSTGVPECVVHDDCATDRVCAKLSCVDPCDGVCGAHTVCHVTNHVAMCSCSPGYSGHPSLGCSPSPGVPGSTGCSGHDQCPASQACILAKCGDPCHDLCGPNTYCTVRHHIPACSCEEGYIGNPFTGCSLLKESGSWPPMPHGKKRFYVENSKTADWHGAFMSCLRNDSRLASIDSMDELEDIRHLIIQTGRRFGQFWTSGSDYGYEGNYIWASTGKQLSATSDMWLRDPTQPDNWQNNEHCVEVWERFQHQGYGLNDRPCQDTIYYICEYYS